MYLVLEVIWFHYIASNERWLPHHQLANASQNELHAGLYSSTSLPVSGLSFITHETNKP